MIYTIRQILKHASILSPVVILHFNHKITYTKSQRDFHRLN